jgi:hypothetical protein
MRFHGRRERWNADAGQLSCVARGQEFVSEPKATPGGRYIGARGDALNWIESLWRGDASHASAVRRADRTEQPIAAVAPTP